jgi:aromatic-L-amino-acid decarboxylase
MEESADSATEFLRNQIKRLERASRGLEPGATRRKHLRNAIVGSSERYIRSIAHQRAYVETKSRAAGLLDVAISRQGIGIDQAIALLEREVTYPGGHPGAPGHLAYIPGGPLYHSALADFLASATNKYAGIFFTGPGPTRMENMLVRWVADLIGYPATAGGTTASGGSIANLTAITTARDAHQLRGADFAKTVVYLTSQAHHSIDKALRIAGLGEAIVRSVPIDDRFRMRPDALAEMIAADRAASLKPWMIVAAAGATDTGAVDPLDAIADVAQRESLWFHVDAAYGGFFMLTEYGRNLLRGIERSDSAILDPHKMLFLPWGSGMVIVRDVRHLAAAHAYQGNYMQDALREPGEISPADVSPELSKPFRALRMWLPLVLLGTDPFRDALEEKLLLARYFHREVQKLGFEAGPDPDLSIVTFRWLRPGASAGEVDAINQRIVDSIRSDGRIFLSSTTLGGRFTIRMAAVSFRTHLRSIDLCLQMLREAVQGMKL